MAHSPQSPHRPATRAAPAVGDDPPPADLVYVDPSHDKGWFDHRRNVDFIVYALFAISAALFAVDTIVPKHSPFAIEYTFGFYAIFGFVGCVALVLIAKGLRVLLMRREDYYDR